MSSYSDFSNAASDILLKKGDALGQAAANKAELWGGTVAQLGQVIPQQVQAAIKQRAELRKKEQIQQIFSDPALDMPSKVQKVYGIDPKLANDLQEQLLKSSELSLKLSEARRTYDKTVRDDGLTKLATASNPDDYSVAYLALHHHDPSLVEGISPDNWEQGKKAAAQRLVKPESLYQTLYPTGKESPLVPIPGPEGKPVYGVPKAGEPVYEKPAGGGGLVPVPGPDGKPVYGVPTAGAPVYEKSAAAEGRNPTEWSLIEAAAKGDKDAIAALRLYRQQHPIGGAEGEPLVPVMGPDGKPVLMRRSRAEGMTPASSREQGRPVTSGDANRLAEISQSLAQAKELESIVGKTGTAPALGAALPNAITQATGIGAAAKTRQGQIALVKQIIGKGLEGGVLRAEDEKKYAKILPTISDPPEVAKNKIKGLQQTLQDKQTALLESLEDANYDTSKFRTRTPAPTSGPKVGDIVSFQGKRYKVTGITNGQADLVPAP